MPKPVVGVIASGYLANGRSAAQLVREKNLRAVADIAEALPLIFAGAPDLTDIGALLDTVDGILLTGEPRQRSSDLFQRRTPSEPRALRPGPG